MNGGGQPLAGLASEDLLISVLAPVDWAVEPVAEHQLRLYGPVEETVDYRPTITFTRGEPEGFGEEWFDRFCAGALDRLERQPGFVIERTERYELSSLAPLHATWYRWEPPGLDAVSQVQASVPASRYRMYLIDAVTLASTGDRDRPLFDAVLRSLRILPPRPGVQ